MRALVLLQAAIERLHAVETHLDVQSYLVDEAVRNGIPGARQGLPEQFFVREDGDELELALYIDPEILGRLERDQPHRKLHEGNLESYFVALEGISHFVFFAWRATVGRPVSPLELEIQAEVDKFVCAWLLLADQGTPLPLAARKLRRQLFESYVLRRDVPQDEARRYHTATRA